MMNHISFDEKKIKLFIIAEDSIPHRMGEIDLAVTK